MLNAFFWGLIATSSLVVGGMLGSRLTIGKRMLGIILAFGAGVLICAVAYELIFEAVQSVKGSGIPVIACLIGALTFFFCDRLIGKFGGEDRKDIDATHKSNLVLPIVLGIILDGIPETMVIGLGLHLNNQVICGTVNAGRAAFEEGVQDLASFVQRFPAALSAMITARVTLDDARDAVLARGGIKSVIAFA